jgi:hypothetical protein
MYIYDLYLNVIYVSMNSLLAALAQLATGYGLNSRGSIAMKNMRLCLRHMVENSSGAHPVSCLMGTGGKLAEASI